MADETNSVRITNAQVYAEVMELKAIQIEAITELRGMKALPDKVSALEKEIARLKVIAGLAYSVFGAVLVSVAMRIL